MLDERLFTLRDDSKISIIVQQKHMNWTALWGFRFNTLQAKLWNHGFHKNRPLWSVLQFHSWRSRRDSKQRRV